MADNPAYAAPFEAQFDGAQSQDYIIRKILRGVHTAQLVQVLAVTAGTANVGFVTVQPLVLDVDTNAVVIPQSPIYNVPFFRYQSGGSAVVMDPVPDDVGLAFFAERDITGTKARAVQDQPLAGAAATDRSHSSADALYIGGMLNGAVVQWVKFLANNAGIDISTPGALTLEGETIALMAGHTLALQAGTSVTQQVGTGAGAATTVLTSTAFTSNVEIVAPDVQLPAGKVNAHNHISEAVGSNTGNMQN